MVGSGGGSQGKGGKRRAKDKHGWQKYWEHFSLKLGGGSIGLDFILNLHMFYTLCYLYTHENNLYLKIRKADEKDILS